MSAKEREAARQQLHPEPEQFRERRVEFAKWDYERRSRRWLEDNRKRFRYLGLNDAELVGRLRSIASEEDVTALLDGLCGRFESGATFSPRIAEVLGDLHTTNLARGRSARTVDRAIHRVLPHLEADDARTVAEELAGCGRRARQLAGWRFYLQYGLDDYAREVVRQLIDSETHVTFRKLVLSDELLVVELGCEKALRLAHNRYWGRIAIESLLEAEAPGCDALPKTHPDEWLWAVAIRRDVARLDQVRQLLREHRSDPGIVNRVLLCVAKLDHKQSIIESLAAADHILATPQPEFEW